MSAVAPERILKWGGGTHVRRKAPGKSLVVPLHFFRTTSTIESLLVIAFVMVSTVRSVSNCLLFLYLQCFRPQTFVKVGARAPMPYVVGADVGKGSTRMLTCTLAKRDGRK